MNEAFTDEQLASFRTTGSIEPPTGEKSRSRWVDAAVVRDVVATCGRVTVRATRIGGKLDLDDLVIAGRVALIDCEFETLSACNAEFGAALVLRKSHASGSIRLLGAKIDGLADFTLLSVGGDCDLTNCRVGSGLPAVGLKVEGIFTAVELRVAASARFTNAIFNGDVDFSNCCVDRTIDFDRCHFSAKATFKNMTALIVNAPSARFDREAVSMAWRSEPTRSCTRRPFMGWPRLRRFRSMTNWT